MTRIATLWLVGRLGLVGLLAACAVPDRAGDDVSQVAATPPATCRVRPDGGPVLADRGIGGTGAHVADRGIGGTGVVGIITGFGSVCVAGLEVGYDGSVAVDIDGASMSVADLRAGQVVVIRARGSATLPLAQEISVRREVIGRIDAVESRTGMLTIAGQAVDVPAGTWGADGVRLGDWVGVSGLRGEDGVLMATRLDIAAPGGFMVRGQVERSGAMARIGGLAWDGAAAGDPKAGQFVTATGRYDAGQAQVSSVASDALYADPAGYFGASVDHLVMQALVRGGNGAVRLNGLDVAVGPDVAVHARDGIGVVSLERRPDGTFNATELRYSDPGASAAAGSVRAGDDGVAMPAPLPHQRSMGSAVVAPTDAGNAPAAAPSMPDGRPGVGQIGDGPAIGAAVEPPVTTPTRSPDAPPATSSVATPEPAFMPAGLAPPASLPVVLPAATSGAGGTGLDDTVHPARSGSDLISGTTPSGAITTTASVVHASLVSAMRHRRRAEHPVVAIGASSSSTISLAVGTATTATSASRARRPLHPLAIHPLERPERPASEGHPELDPGVSSIK